MNFSDDRNTKTDDIGFLLSLPIWLAVFGGGISIAFLAYGQANAAKDIALLSLGAAGGATVQGRRGTVSVQADRSYIPVDVEGREDDLP